MKRRAVTNNQDAFWVRRRVWFLRKKKGLTYTEARKRALDEMYKMRFKPQRR